MRRVALVATLAISTFLTTAVAQAKGPAAVTLTNGAVSITVEGNGEPGAGSLLSAIADSSGFFGLVYGAVSGISSEPPVGPLGDAITAVWSLPAGPETTETVVMQIYVAAPGGALTFVAPGQFHFGQPPESHGGWFRAGAPLVTALEDAGLLESPQVKSVPTPQDPVEKAVSVTAEAPAVEAASASPRAATTSAAMAKGAPDRTKSAAWGGPTVIVIVAAAAALAIAGGAIIRRVQSRPA